MRDSPPRRECACAIAGSLHLCFPSHCPPAGAPGQAGPCSPAPAPVGFVSIGRRHPGCTLHATPRTSLRRLEAAGALGWQDVWGPILHPGARTSRCCLPVGGGGHRPHLSLRGRMGTESRCQPCPLHLSAPGSMLRCRRDCCRWAVSVRVGPVVSWPGPCPQRCLCQAERSGRPAGGEVGSRPVPSHLAPFI